MAITDATNSQKRPVSVLLYSTSQTNLSIPLLTEIGSCKVCSRQWHFPPSLGFGPKELRELNGWSAETERSVE